jgi:Rho-binding antiterminator
MEHPIPCEKHDLIEIACLYGYQLKLILTDASQVEGKAMTTLTSPGKREYLIINVNNLKQKIELNQLKKIQVITRNAVFEELSL